MPLLDYIKCNSKIIMHCDFYMHDDCPETCAYALDIGSLGVGAPMVPVVRNITKELSDKLFQEDKSDY